MTTSRVISAIVFGATLSVATTTHAQQFSGPYVNAGIGFKSSTMKFTLVDTDPADSSTTSGDFLGHSEFFGSVAAGWNWNPSGPFVLGVGIFADLGSTKAGDVDFTDSTGTTSSSIKQKNRYGIALEPGYEFNPRTVGYLKLTWNRSKYDFSSNDSTSGFPSVSLDFDGYGYGAGLKYLATDNIFVFAEWMQVQYDDKSVTMGTITNTFKPRNTLGLIGVGWQF